MGAPLRARMSRWISSIVRRSLVARSGHSLRSPDTSTLFFIAAMPFGPDELAPGTLRANPEPAPAEDARRGAGGARRGAGEDEWPSAPSTSARTLKSESSTLDVLLARCSLSAAFSFRPSAGGDAFLAREPELLPPPVEREPEEDAAREAFAAAARCAAGLGIGLLGFGCMSAHANGLQSLLTLTVLHANVDKNSQAVEVRRPRQRGCTRMHSPTCSPLVLKRC